MRPFYTFYDFIDRSFGDTILFAESFIAAVVVGIARSNLANIFFSQFRIVVTFAARQRRSWATSCGAAFVRFIGAVVFVRAKKEVVRADARGVVTFVADKQAVWDSAEMQFLRKAVCWYFFPLYEKAPVSKNPPCGTLINPTMGGLFYVSPEPFFRQSVTSGIRARATAKARPAGFEIGRSWMILRAAMEAVSYYLSHKRSITQAALALQGWVMP